MPSFTRRPRYPSFRITRCIYLKMMLYICVWRNFKFKKKARRHDGTRDCVGNFFSQQRPNMPECTHVKVASAHYSDDVVTEGKLAVNGDTEGRHLIDGETLMTVD